MFAKHSAVSYTIRVLAAIWRRKTALFCILLMILVLIVCIQYNVTREMLVHTQPSSKQSSLESLIGYSTGSVEQPSKHDLSDVKFIDNQQRAVDNGIADDPADIYSNSDAAGAPEMVVGNNVRHWPGTNNGAVLPDGVYIPAQRLVHLDLKGAPPKVNFLKKFLKFVKSLGATGILLEWEDMFPWQDNLSVLAAKNAYSVEDVHSIIFAAKKLNLEVIPLVQTFGHLEFALKNPEFYHLREVPDSPQSLCPSLNASVELVEDMIDQVMKVHRDANFIHIGCDEVFNFGECPRCRMKVREKLFLSHVYEVASFVRRKYPNTTPIIWDDMLRHISLSVLQMFKIGDLVEPMVWVYAEDVYRFVPLTIWEKYGSVFPHVWTASAYKGAFGETYFIPNAKRHLDNNLSWMQVMDEQKSKFSKGFRGIALTGWQRYDHFAVLCELLPAAIPSLAADLLAVSNGYRSPNQTFKESLFKILNCGVVAAADARDSFTFENDPFLWEHYSKCQFLGNSFYRLLYQLRNMEKDVEEFLHATKKSKGWMTDYNIRRNYSSPLRVDELMTEESRIYQSLISLIDPVQNSLKDIFDEYTVAEWIEQNIYPMVLRVEQVQNAAKLLKSPKYWPRRPLPVFSDLQRIGVSLPTASNDLSKKADLAN